MATLTIDIRLTQIGAENETQILKMQFPCHSNQVVVPANVSAAAAAAPAAAVAADAAKIQKKRFPSAFTLYSRSVRADMKLQHAEVEPKELAKLILTKWEELAEDDKAPFVTQAKALAAASVADNKKKRSADEMEEGSEQEAAAPKKVKDPNAPKRGTPAFMLFAQKKRADLKTADPSATLPSLKEMGEAWKEASTEDKKPFTEIAEADAKRYRAEMDEYKAKNGGGGV